MNGKLKIFLTQILALLSLVIAINLFAFIAIKFGFLNSEYSMAGCTVIGVGAYLIYLYTLYKDKKRKKEKKKNIN